MTRHNRNRRQACLPSIFKSVIRCVSTSSKLGVTHLSTNLDASACTQSVTRTMDATSTAYWRGTWIILGTSPDNPTNNKQTSRKPKVNRGRQPPGVQLLNRAWRAYTTSILAQLTKFQCDAICKRTRAKPRKKGPAGTYSQSTAGFHRSIAYTAKWVTSAYVHHGASYAASGLKSLMTLALRRACGLGTGCLPDAPSPKKAFNGLSMFVTRAGFLGIGNSVASLPPPPSWDRAEALRAHEREMSVRPNRNEVEWASGAAGVLDAWKARLYYKRKKVIEGEYDTVGLLSGGAIGYPRESGGAMTNILEQLARDCKEDRSRDPDLRCHKAARLPGNTHPLESHGTILDRAARRIYEDVSCWSLYLTCINRRLSLFLNTIVASYCIGSIPKDFTRQLPLGRVNIQAEPKLKWRISIVTSSAINGVTYPLARMITALFQKEPYIFGMAPGDQVRLTQFIDGLQLPPGWVLRSTDWKGGSNRLTFSCTGQLGEWLQDLGNMGDDRLMTEVIQSSCREWVYVKPDLTHFLTRRGVGMGWCLTWLMLNLVNLVALVLSWADYLTCNPRSVYLLYYCPAAKKKQLGEAGTFHPVPLKAPGERGEATEERTAKAKQVHGGCPEKRGTSWHNRCGYLQIFSFLVDKVRVCGDDLVTACPRAVNVGYTVWLQRSGADVHPHKDITSRRSGIFVGVPIITKSAKPGRNRTFTTRDCVAVGQLLGDVPGWMGAGPGTVAALATVKHGSARYRYLVTIANRYHAKLRKDYYDAGLNPDLPGWLGGGGFATNHTLLQVVRRSDYRLRLAVIQLGRYCREALAGLETDTVDPDESIVGALTHLMTFSSVWKVSSGDWSLANVKFVGSLLEYSDLDHYRFVDPTLSPPVGFTRITKAMDTWHSRLACKSFYTRRRGPCNTERKPQFWNIARLIKKRISILACVSSDLRAVYVSRACSTGIHRKADINTLPNIRIRLKKALIDIQSVWDRVCVADLIVNSIPKLSMSLSNALL